MNKANAKKEIEKCLNEMYKASTPPITWVQIKKKYSGAKVQFYLKHSLPEAKYEKIKEKYIAKLGKRWERELAWWLLDYSPITTESLKIRKELGLNE